MQDLLASKYQMEERRMGTTNHNFKKFVQWKHDSSKNEEHFENSDMKMDLNGRMRSRKKVEEVEEVHDGCWDDEMPIIEAICCNGKTEGPNLKEPSGGN